MLAPAPPTAAPAAVDERADLDLLAGPDAEELLRAVLAAEGVELETWSTHAVHHRPGVGVTVGWAVTWTLGAARGEEYLLGTTAPLPGNQPALQVVELAGRVVRVWRHPVDPALPGLATASSREALAVTLGPVNGLELVTYRPLRRAVLRARTPDRTVYLKVVRPHTAVLLEQRHTMLSAAGLPVAPAELHDDGVLVLGEVSGTPLTQAFADDGAARVRPGDVLALLDRFPVEVLGLKRRPSWAERVADHAGAAAAALPGSAQRIAALTATITDLLRRSDAGPVVPTHGDLHDGNLLLDGPTITGLLDIDSVGPGHRVDDLACLLAHVSVLPALAPEIHRHVPGALQHWTEALATTVDPLSLYARTGAVVLSLVAGARMPGDPAWRQGAEARLDIAAEWVAQARSLRDLSPGAPRPLIGAEHLG